MSNFKFIDPAGKVIAVWIAIASLASTFGGDGKFAFKKIGTKQYKAVVFIDLDNNIIL